MCRVEIGGYYMSQPLSKETMTILDSIAAILLRCFIITVVAMLFVWLVFLVMGDYIYQGHTLFFDITQREFDLFFLYSMTFIKSLNVVFFLFPFIAIKHFLRNKAEKT